MIKSNIIANSILSNHVHGNRVARPTTRDVITDAILCEDGSPLLFESGDYFQLEKPASVKKNKIRITCQ